MRLSKSCLRTRVSDERGFSLIEMLVTLTLLGVVLAGITSTLSSGARLESDLNPRFQAQQGARLALTTFRREAHCASLVTPSSGATTSVTLTLPAGCTTGTGSTTWCAVVSGNRFDLWRIPGATCTTTAGGAARWAQNLTTQQVFTPDATVHAPAVLPSIAVNFRVYGGQRTYVLTDTVYLRNGSRL